MRSKRTDRQAGFTLIETITVVFLAVVVTGISIPVLGNLYSSFRLRASVESLVGEIQLAKLKAVNLNASVTLTINAASKTYQLQNEGLKYLNNSVSFQGSPPASLVFDSRGRLSSGTTATINLVGGNGNVITITINPSGRISVS